MTAPVLSRRSLLLATGAAALTLPMRWANAATWKGYNDAIVIDGLGGPGSITMQPGEKLSEAHLKDVRDSGLTAVLITLGPVGTTPPDAAFKDLVRGLVDVDRDIERHPDTFCSHPNRGGYHSGQESRSAPASSAVCRMAWRSKPIWICSRICISSACASCNRPTIVAT